jgi:vancomycin resistance protein YoaR
VRYYEPAGTDATIYGPKPDFRFTNDTGNYILIQTKIEGDNLVFEFWGTQDGRIAEQTKPVIYNVTAPPPTRYIETADIPEGEIKCTEHAVPGADTSFDYAVTYQNGEHKSQTFKSHYRAWQEVCLVGVAPEKLQSQGAAEGNAPPADGSGESAVNSYN